MNYRTKAIAAFLGVLLTTAAAIGVVQLAGGGSSGPAALDNVAVASATPAANGSSGIETSTTQTAADIYEAVRPSVVEITTTVSGAFGQQGQGTGTGVVIDEQGHILTNNHVVAGAQTIEVRFDDGDTVTAEVIGTDPANDLAVIRVNPSAHDLSPATLGDSSELRVGDPVLALGNPFNLEGTLTQGIVSALDRTYSGGASTRPIRHMIQTDAAVNPGNSGGPLINSAGEIVGINTLLENPTGANVNVGVAFAVAINTAKQSLSDMLAGDTVDHPWLGIAGIDVSPAVAEQAGLDVDSGVYLTLVSANSPAAEAGLQGAFASEQEAAGSEAIPPGGDVIRSADGQGVTSIDELATYLDENKRPGDTVELGVIRDGNEITVEAALAEWPS